MASQTAFQILSKLIDSSFATEYDHYFSMVADELAIPANERGNYTFDKVVNLLRPVSTRTYKGKPISNEVVAVKKTVVVPIKAPVKKTAPIKRKVFSKSVPPTTYSESSDEPVEPDEVGLSVDDVSSSSSDSATKTESD